jgi:hypothetical protein
MPTRSVALRDYTHTIRRSLIKGTITFRTKVETKGKAIHPETCTPLAENVAHMMAV